MEKNEMSGVGVTFHGKFFMNVVGLESGLGKGCARNSHARGASEHAATF
jgi:hypothetical protein